MFPGCREPIASLGALCDARPVPQYPARPLHIKRSMVVQAVANHLPKPQWMPQAHICSTLLAARNHP